jgi:chorismate synthase
LPSLIQIFGGILKKYLGRRRIMGNVWGKHIQFSIFGESHGPAVGFVLAGLPAGWPIDWEEADREMTRRAPGRSPLTTPRRESDCYEILSGWFEGKTTGTPLSVIIPNQNARSGDYRPELLRPGHADLTALYKYHGHADYRGGGHFSGRLSAPRVLAGAIAKQILRMEGIVIGARIQRIFDVEDGPMPTRQILQAAQKTFPVWDEAAAEAMQQAILRAKRENDSLGGIIECAALGLPPGWGDPFFDSLESAVAAMMFSIPAVKGVEFGDGFALASMTGSAANDPLYVENGAIRLASNHNGGINGGISNGEPLVVRVAIKPTPTIGRPQTTVDWKQRKTVTAAFTGRHDPCIVPRAVPAVEAGLALCLLDILTENKTRKEGSL